MTIPPGYVELPMGAACRCIKSLKIDGKNYCRDCGNDKRRQPSYEELGAPVFDAHDARAQALKALGPLA